jgi:hypothetical protein
MYIYIYVFLSVYLCIIYVCKVFYHKHTFYLLSPLDRLVIHDNHTYMHIYMLIYIFIIRYRHDEESLLAIWGEYDRRLWVCKDGLTSSFIELLHESGLAYPLYDPCGQSVGMSLIIAMLPVRYI